MIAHWAHIDADGWVISWGECPARDVFLQELGAGLTAIGRPPEVNGWGPWRYLNGAWVLDEEGSEA